MTTEPTIMCPSCRTEIKLTESLAAPLIEVTRQQYEKKLSEQTAEFVKREQTVRTLEQQVTKERLAVEATIDEKLKQERAKIAVDAVKREQAMRAREEQLAKEKDAVDTTIDEKLKLERAKLAADAAKREQAIKAREEHLAKEKDTIDATVDDRLKQERDKIAADGAKREQIIKDREVALLKEKDSIESTVAEKIRSERGRIATEESKKAKLALGDDIEQKAREIADLNEVLKARDSKLAEAQKAQAELIRKQRELDDSKREMDLTIETRVQESLTKVRDIARRDAEQEISLKVIEKDLTINSMKVQIEELRRKAEQGSQQIQGEALEWQLESLLSSKFLHDRIEAVPKGEHGGDILQRIVMPTGVACGTILWESKRTKNWSQGWLAKLRDDQRQAKAEIAVIVSMILPEGVETFDQIDGVWIVHPRAVVPMAMSLRHMLIEVQCARKAGEGQQTKMEMVYHYLTGPRFRLRLEAIVESFSGMSDDLTKEKKVILKQWAKREEQISRVMEATVGMYGELQGIAGKTLGEIEGLTTDAATQLASKQPPTAAPVGMLAADAELARKPFELSS